MNDAGCHPPHLKIHLFRNTEGLEIIIFGNEEESIFLFTDTFYGQLQCKVLILRATKGLFSEKDLLLPEPVIERMVREIPNAKRVDVQGVNHYGIVFQPNRERDQELLAFLGS